MARFGITNPASTAVDMTNVTEGMDTITIRPTVTDLGNIAY